MNSTQYRVRMQELLQALQQRQAEFNMQLTKLQKQNQQAESVAALRIVSQQTLLLSSEFHEQVAKLRQALEAAQEQFEQAQAGTLQAALLS